VSGLALKAVLHIVHFRDNIGVRKNALLYEGLSKNTGHPHYQGAHPKTETYAKK